ncbi:hypothetical protein [Sphaerimonospora thailandensis]|nr:hypothetical protein [Sphaerimonospora thailandensis]
MNGHGSAPAARGLLGTGANPDRYVRRGYVHALHDDGGQVRKEDSKPRLITPG